MWIIIYWSAQALNTATIPMTTSDRHILPPPIHRYCLRIDSLQEGRDRSLVRCPWGTSDYNRPAD